MFTFAPANFVPGDATAAWDGDAAGDPAGADATGTDATGADGDGLVAGEQAVRTRIVLIAAATKRYRDTAGSPPLDIRRRSFSILNRWRYAGQYADQLGHSQDAER
jgi:hypothetical protein